MNPQIEERGWQRGYWSLIATQFQGAFNENTLKNLIIFIILAMGIGEADRDRLVLVVGTLFSAPFILFSMTGGFLADRFSKRSVTIFTKIFEMSVMVLALVGLVRGNIHIELTAIFLASTQAALLDPRNTDCCRRCFRRSGCRGEMVFWS